MEVLSGKDANPSIPDMTPATQYSHTKHIQKNASYAGMSMEQYVEKSGKLARSAVGGDILGYKADDGAIVRYDRAANDWVRAYSTGVASMYKPKGGKAYYIKTKERDTRRARDSK